MTSVGSKQAFSVQWGVRVCIRRPSCPSVVRRIPNTLHPWQIWVKAMRDRPQRKDAPHNTTVSRFHSCSEYWELCAQDSVQESVPCLSRVGTWWRKRIIHNKVTLEPKRTGQCMQGNFASLKDLVKQCPFKRKFSRVPSEVSCVSHWLINVHNKKLCGMQATKNTDPRCGNATGWYPGIENQRNRSENATGKQRGET